jgi:endonuclease YncB( thermonuclease family)
MIPDLDLNRLAAIFILCLLATPVLADVTGPARVVDGDTLEIQGQRIRLHGIDAPESRQVCRLDGKPWQCGKDSGSALAEKIARRPMTCEDLGRDRYKRIIARCTVAGEDIGAWMVLEGLALAYRRFSLDYVDQESEAEAERRGIWAGEFVKPWEWRQGTRLETTAHEECDVCARRHERLLKRPDKCAIKGNINAKGERIYHMPGQQAYSVTRVNPAAGERWFCSEAGAEAAGWRKALR